MIAVTLGTTPYPFNRVIWWLAELIDQGIIAESVFLQHGYTDIKIIQKYDFVTAVPLMSAKELDKKITKARLVISHAGQGSTRKLACQNKSFVIVPRLAVYGEHVDDHQLRFSEGVSQMGIVICTDIKALENAITNVPTPFNKELFAGPKLGDFLAQKYAPKIVKDTLPTFYKLNR
jgi:UDP-N-acetylglucosamine transferase subunit ALG13